MYHRRNKKSVPVQVKRVAEPKKPVVLVATSELEYHKLIRDYPDRTIILDIPYEQGVLFNTRTYLDV